jgi:hypothetical protein
MMDTGRVGFLTMTPRKVSPEGITPRPNPIKPLGGPFRRWHLSPWKRTEATALLDDLDGSDPVDESESDTSGYDIVNNLITQAGSVFVARSGGVVPYPRPGQLVPRGSGSVSSALGMSTQTMLLLGVAAVGVVLLMKKK